MLIQYLITDPKYYSNDIEKFKKTLINSYSKHNVDFALFRDKINSNIQELAKIFLEISHIHNIQKTFISSNINLALKLGFDGVHLTSTQFNQIKYTKSQNLYTIISTHNTNEIERAIKLGADAITYSPIFATPNKGNPLGIEHLNNISKKYNIDIIALGGIITQTQIDSIAKSNAKGFASIRYFV